jgi:hypothetical protein
MLSIDLPQDLEKRLEVVIQRNYQGNWAVAVSSWLQLQEQTGWKVQRLDEVTASGTANDLQELQEKRIAEVLKHSRQPCHPVGTTANQNRLKHFLQFIDREAVPVERVIIPNREDRSAR